MGATVPTDAEILLSAQAKGRRILDEALEGATEILSAANEVAATCLLLQSRAAAELLLAEHALAIAAGIAAKANAAGLDRAEAASFLARCEKDAEALRQRAVQVAAARVETEMAFARAAADEVQCEACDLLMASQRQAAVVLLEARMLVERNRGSE